MGAAALAATPGGIWMPSEEEPRVRRYWQVGDLFSRKKTAFGLAPVQGMPGIFRDMATGQIINIRDFKESDAYDTIILPINPRYIEV